MIMMTTTMTSNGRKDNDNNGGCSMPPWANEEDRLLRSIDEEEKRVRVQSGASYLWQGFVMFFHVSCEGLPGQ